MVFFFGTKVVQRPLPTERKVCPNCLSVTDHTVVEHDTRLTFYFIPLVSINRSVTYTCSHCGDSHSVEYAEYLAAHPAAETAPVKAPPGSTQPRGSAQKADSPRDKAKAILEGKVARNADSAARAPNRPPDSEAVLRWMYIGFAVVVVVSVILFALLLTILAR